MTYRHMRSSDAGAVSIHPDVTQFGVIALQIVHRSSFENALGAHAVIVKRSPYYRRAITLRSHNQRILIFVGVILLQKNTSASRYSPATAFYVEPTAAKR